MNREIKFRARAIQNGQWIVGDLIHKRHNGDEEVIIQESNGCGTDCDINTVGEFTGLKDKNGKDVYEGDIVEVTCLDISQYGRKMLCSIVYDGKFSCYLFKASDRIRSILSTISDAEIEVIGNIHENQELMKDD